MKKQVLIAKGISVCIVMLFLCSNLATGTKSNSLIDTAQGKKMVISDELKTSFPCTFYFFGKTGIEQYKSMVSRSDAAQLSELLDQLKTEMSVSPVSEKTQQLQQNFFDLLQTKAVLPPEITKEQFMSVLQPSAIPSSHPVRNPVLLGSKASERLCTFVSEGSGAAFPIIILPRFIPILLTPIPRVILRWNAKEGFTSCGGLRSGTGFISYGQQKGIALGFWGVGFTFSLPPVMNTYGLLGYALYASVTADQIDHYPPNNPPEITETDPAAGQELIPLSLSKLRFQINDVDGDLMSYMVTTNPDVGSGSGGLKTNGLYSIPISGLESLTQYTWTIQVSDGKDSIQQLFTFTTEPTAPLLSNPSPTNGKRDVPLNLSQLTFTVKDFQGDAMEYTVETVPYIGSGHVVGIHNGTYSIPVSNLAIGTTYHWYINITDGTYWTRKTLSFETGYPASFNPFDYGWKYKKQITIDHTKVVDDLTNFPILISTTDEDLKQKAQGNGGDILFMSTAGQSTRLYHDLDTYDSSTGALVAWVNIPILSSTQDTTLYMYYGNPNCIYQSYPEKTWDSNYIGVWHMSDASGDIKDSTGTQNGIVHGSPLYHQAGVGTIGYSVYLPGIDEYYFDITNNMYKWNTEDLTLEAWINFPENRNLWDYIFYFGDVGAGYFFPSLVLCRARSGYAGGGGALMTQNTFDNGDGEYVHDGVHMSQWVYDVGRYKRGEEMSLYINGKEESNSTTFSPNDVAGGSGFCARIGFGATYTVYDHCAKVYIDELRISKGIARSPEWIQTSYKNHNSPSTFLSVGPEEPGP